MQRLNSDSYLEKKFLDVLELGDGTIVRLPVMTMKGSRPGPRISLVAAMHGWEVLGIEIIRQLFREKLDPLELRGTIEAIPIGNPLAYSAVSYVSPQDMGDMENSVPGDNTGSASKRIGNKIWEVVKGADCFIDLHCIEGPSLPYVIVRASEQNPEATKRSFELARAFGLPMSIPSRATPTGLPALHAISQGTAAFTPELPFPGMMLEKASIEMGVRGVLNVMKALRMIEGEMEPQKENWLKTGELLHTQIVFSNRGGLVHPTCDLGSRITEKQVVAKILNQFGEEVDQVRSPRDGFLIGFPLSYSWVPVNQVTYAGGPVCIVGYLETT